MLNKLNIDQAIEKVGGQGRYQITIFIVYIFMFFITYFVFCGAPYLYLEPTYLCHDIKCDQEEAFKLAGNDAYKV